MANLNVSTKGGVHPAYNIALNIFKSSTKFISLVVAVVTLAERNELSANDVQSIASSVAPDTLKARILQTAAAYLETTEVKRPFEQLTQRLIQRQAQLDELEWYRHRLAAVDAQWQSITDLVSTFSPDAQARVSYYCLFCSFLFSIFYFVTLLGLQESPIPTFHARIVRFSR